MKGDTLNLDAIEAAWADSPALISNVIPALVAEVRRLREERATTDLADRLRTAVARLEHLRDRPTTGGYEKARLNGKIDGVKLAAAYLEEGERIFPGAVSSS